MGRNKKRVIKSRARLTALLLALAMTISLAAPAAAAETAAAIRLSKTEGTVKISKSSGRSVSMRDNMRLYSGYHVETGEKSYAWLDLDETKLIKEDASSETEVRKSGKKLEVNVVSGQVFFNVAESLKEDETLNISTSTMVVGIRGTTGWVRVVDRWKTEVCLLEGTVQCVVTDPVTGQLKTAVLQGGDVAECIVYPQDKAGDKCDITMKQQTVDGIPGYALTDLVRDVPLCDKILEDSGLDILGGLAQTAGGPEDGRAPGGSSASQEVIREAEKRQEQEEVQTGQKLEDIRQEVSEQDNNVSQTGVWGEKDATTPSPDSGGGSESTSTPPASGPGSASTPATSGIMKLSDVQVQALLDGAGSIAVRANTDAADSTPNKNLLEIDNGLSVAAGKTLTLDSGVDVAVRPGKTLQVDGTMHTSGNLTDEGTVNVTSGDTLWVGGDLTLGSSGTLNVSATGRVVADGTFDVLTGGVLQPQASTAVVMAREFSGTGGAIGLPAGWKISDTKDSEGYYHLLPATSYLISFDANGGTLGAGVGGNTPVGMSTNPDGTINLSAIPNPTRDGYTFSGWFTDPTGGTQVMAATTFTADATIYAQWDIAPDTYTVNFFANDGTGTVIATQVTDPGGGPVTWPADPSRTAGTAGQYIFDGWYDQPAGGTQYVEVDERGATASFGADTDLYAHWSGWGYVQETNTLTVAGGTAVADYTSGAAGDPPWSIYASEITSVRFISSPTRIGNAAFSGCTALTSVTIPSTVTEIGSGSFMNCTALNNVTVPTSVKTIAASAFSGCTGLMDLILSDGIQTIGNGSFARTGLTSVTIPSNVTSIEALAFSSCASLQTVNIQSNQITTIADATFQGCSNLATINIPNSVTSIQQRAFDSCSKLSSITLPNSLTSIGVGAFLHSGLTHVTIPSNVTTISESTFQQCSQLTSVSIPNGVTTIDRYAFEYCTALPSITIPDSVTSIGNNAFNQCTALTSVALSGNSLQTIGASAFGNCKLLETVSLPSSVTSIGNYTFNNCEKLSSDNLNLGNLNSLQTISTGIFENCTAFTNITIPSNVTSIETLAFKGCNHLTEVTIPNKVNHIAINAFQDCLTLATINYTGTETQWNSITKDAPTGLEGKTITYN